MRSVRVLINVMLKSIIANAVLRVYGQSTTDNSDPSNNNNNNIASIPALDQLNQDSTFLPGYNVAPNDTPNKENSGTGDSPNPLNLDILSGTGDPMSISDSSNCAGNLGKREDSDLTLGN